jgi:predicted nucleic acid-binding protein
VVDAGPLSALGEIGAVSLLRLVFPDVLIPSAVHDEVVSSRGSGAFPDAVSIDLAVGRGELSVVPVLDSELSSDLAALPLGRGEKQAIYLALREHTDLVLIDDAEARSAATACGLRVKGTLGIMVEAVRSGGLASDDAVRLVQIIQARDDIWIKESVCQAVLAGIRR